MIVCDLSLPLIDPRAFWDQSDPLLLKVGTPSHPKVDAKAINQVPIKKIECLSESLFS
jgi:hypothetical protein